MILQALDRYYKRMEDRQEAAPFGYAVQQIGYALTLSSQGELQSVAALGSAVGKRQALRSLIVPAPITEPKARTASAIVPYFLWDKPSYLTGVDTGETNTERKYEASRELHLRLLAGATEPALVAVRRYFERYRYGDLESLIPVERRDRPYVFALFGTTDFAHDGAEARTIWADKRPRREAELDQCLVTGELRTPERLHPKLGGFKDADSLISFDADAFCSYGAKQGANAPVSDVAAHRYGAALNGLLAFGSRNRLRFSVGDTTVVFWADTSELIKEPSALAAENFFASWLEPTESEDLDDVQAAKLRAELLVVAQGRPQELGTDLREGTRFHVLGLSPNVARLAVRFWLSDTLQAFSTALERHASDLLIEPRPRNMGVRPPAVGRLLAETTALKREAKHVPPLLAGELTRAILTGATYPRTWLTAAITRLRAGDSPAGGWHAAAIKACINRQNRSGRKETSGPFREDVPVARDPENESVAYQLGRLFAVLEAAQREALGKKLNTTIVDRYYGAASSTPARVFPSLLRGARVHVSDAKKQNKGFWVEPRLNEIVGRLPPALPNSLKLEDQGRFAVGYYHERAFRKEDDDHVTDPDGDPAVDEAA